MPACRDCGEPIQFLPGKKAPYDLEPRIHFANPKHIAATKGPRNGHRKATKRSERPEFRTKVLDWALSQKWDRGWCEAQVDGAEGEDEMAVLKAVMAAKGKELLE